MLEHNENVIMRKKINKSSKTSEEGTFQGCVLLYEYYHKGKTEYGTCIEHIDGKTQFYKYGFIYEDALRNFNNRNSWLE